MEYHFHDTQPYLLKELKEKLKDLHYDIVDIPLSNGLGLLFATKVKDDDAPK